MKKDVPAGANSEPRVERRGEKPSGQGECRSKSGGVNRTDPFTDHQVPCRTTRQQPKPPRRIEQIYRTLILTRV